MADLATLAKDVGLGNVMALLMAAAVGVLWRENRRLYGLLLRTDPRRKRRRK